ncbi:unnamed protein product [Ceratitis capitata]|uniref:(Mediterranean fruit fly) hypothetical protein n=1 Tax=Ceratitis capitata TaxID=7213 RepID=A0A811UDY8_CERCA|nr:unnamed protein product [Ceratitis capitata]
MREEMRYKLLHCYLSLLCSIMLFLHNPITPCALHSKYFNTPTDDETLFGMEPTDIFERKRSMTCDSCGNECTNACGTKNFRTCCFNYLRKRNDPGAMNSISNKRLIDFILLQGRAAMYTLDEHLNTGDPVVVADMRSDENGKGEYGGDGKAYSATDSGHRIMSGRHNFQHMMV